MNGVDNILHHAIMVEGSNDSSILQQTINILDSSKIDFFIHWDKKFSKPKLNAVKSEIKFIDPISVSWGSDSQIKVELLLINAVLKQVKQYDYLHLISESDIPLMSKDYFINFFAKSNSRNYVGYQSKDDKKILERINWYYPFGKFNLRSSWGRYYVKFLKLINKTFKINRNCHNLNIYKGPNWFSITSNSAKEIVTFKYLKMFNHTYLADEILVQTILGNRHPDNVDLKGDDNLLAARYIDWERGKPYSFTDDDYSELISHVNANYAFARKIKSRSLATNISSFLLNSVDH